MWTFIFTKTIFFNSNKKSYKTFSNFFYLKFHMFSCQNLWTFILLPICNHEKNMKYFFLFRPHFLHVHISKICEAIWWWKNKKIVFFISSLKVSDAIKVYKFWHVSMWKIRADKNETNASCFFSIINNEWWDKSSQILTWELREMREEPIAHIFFSVKK